MTRIVHRRYGRTGQSSYGADAMYVIKCGWDIRAQGAERMKPQRLRGFIICRNVVRQGQPGFEIAYDLMEKLDYHKDSVHKAIQAGLSAEYGLLPDTLDFVILQDAKRQTIDSPWEFPGVYQEEYSCWDKGGLFCSGNGEVAMRRSNMARVEIACNPVGKFGADTFCDHSIKKECRAHSRLIVTLIVNECEGRREFKPAPLDRSCANATFRLDSGSEYGQLHFVGALTALADRCVDRDNPLLSQIHAIPGTLSLSVQRKRHSEGVGIVPILNMTFNEFAIKQREQEIHQRYLEDAQAQKEPLRIVHEKESPVQSPEPEPEPIPAEFVPAEPEPEQEPQTQGPEYIVITVDDATDDELCEGLISMAESLAVGSGSSLADEMKNITQFEKEGKTYSVIDPKDLLKTPERRAILRRICLGFEKDRNSAFSLRRVKPCE